MTAQPFTAVSLFTGAGGLDLGLEQAGFRTATAIDSDPNCITTLLANQNRPGCGNGLTYFSGARLVRADLETIAATDLKPVSAGRDWVPDLLAGGPPCQPFSSAGAMGSLGDPRGRLFEHFVRLAGELRPRSILFENVRGLVTARGPQGEPGEVLRLVRAAFETLGYATTFALLNAADFGCPQRRVRCFMMATRDAALPEFPVATHAEFPGCGLFDALPRWVSLGEYLATVPPARADEIVRPSERLAVQLACAAPGSGLKSAGARESTRPGGHWGYRQGTFVADPAQPARTVTASTSQDWIRLPDGSLRRLTLRECAGLQGFPTDWQFAGPLASRFRQVGNAVPSVLGLALGRCLIAALAGGRRARPESAPLPRGFAAAAEYTRREQARNGESRRAVREKLGRPGIALGTVKGLGSAELAGGRNAAGGDS